MTSNYVLSSVMRLLKCFSFLILCLPHSLVLTAIYDMKCQKFVQISTCVRQTLQSSNSTITFLQYVHKCMQQILYKNVQCDLNLMIQIIYATKQCLAGTTMLQLLGDFVSLTSYSWALPLDPLGISVPQAPTFNPHQKFIE